MAISYTTRIEGDLLNVEAVGHVETLAEIQGYSLAVIEAARNGSCTRVLCDERELAGTLRTLDAYEAAKFIADQAPSVGRAAVVCGEAALGDRKFWETVAVNRGVALRAFADIDTARAWLFEDQRSTPV